MIWWWCSVVTGVASKQGTVGGHRESERDNAIEGQFNKRLMSVRVETTVEGA